MTFFALKNSFMEIFVSNGLIVIYSKTCFCKIWFEHLLERQIICGITDFYMRHYQRNIRTSLSLHEYFRKGQKKITGVFQCWERTIGNIINEFIGKFQ